MKRWYFSTRLYDITSYCRENLKHHTGYLRTLNTLYEQSCVTFVLAGIAQSGCTAKGSEFESL
jgi:hypothetical protein